VTDTRKERRHGCDQRKKEWRKSEEEWEAKTSERKSGQRQRVSDK
jgi:hypothetical protein